MYNHAPDGYDNFYLTQRVSSQLIGEDFRSLMDCELVLNKPAQTSEVSTPVFEMAHPYELLRSGN